MSNHLQALCDAAVRDELSALGEQVEAELGGLDDNSRFVIASALRDAFVAGVRVGIVDSVADVIEQTGIDLQLDLHVT